MTPSPFLYGNRATTLNIVALPGSLRIKSYNHAALKAATSLAPDGLTIKIVDYLDIPLYNGGL